MGNSNVKTLSTALLVFSIAFALFMVGPPLLGRPFGAYPLMKTGDLVDLLTPVVLIPLYWLLFRLDGQKPPGIRETLVFLSLAAIWVEGQGMHLSANSIGHLLKGMQGSDPYRLTGFYDEVLSHYLWHFGIMALSALLIVRQWRNSFAEGHSVPRLVVAAGLVYGLTYFVIVIEGSTALMGVPFAAFLTLFGLTWGRKKLKQPPLILFFVIGHAAATALFTGWGIHWKGLPEFSQVGIID